MRARSIAVAVVMLLSASPALGAPHRSLRTPGERTTMIAVDELTREQARRREKIALLQADAERRERTDRTFLIGAIGIAGLVAAVAVKNARTRARRR